MKPTVEHHHYFHGFSDDNATRLFNQILKNQHKMNEDLQQIKTDLETANTTLGKVKADVTLLHTKIDAIPGQPTAEEWAEVKTLAANLKTGLQEVDDQTAEETQP
jgi:hypothetical protein